MKNNRGFTLIEMVISILLMSILVLGVSMLIAKPMEAYARSQAQQELHRKGEYILNRITRDVQNAVPNSIRVTLSTQYFLELVPVLAAARYRTIGTGALSFSSVPQSSFNILQDYTTLSNTLYASGSWFLTNNPDPSATVNGVPNINAPADPLSAGLPFRVIIYNTGQYVNANYNAPYPGINIYNPSTYSGSDNYPATGSHVITPADMGVIFTDAGGGETTLSLVNTTTLASYPMLFAFPSPKNIVYIADSPVTYHCDTSNGSYRLWRYRDYPLSASQPVGGAALGSDPYYNPGWNALTRIIEDGVTQCSFSYQVEPGQNMAIFTIQMTLSELDTSRGIVAGGESVDFFRQIQVKNVL